MKIIFLFFFCSLALAQQPTNIFAGKMTCSARRLTPDDVQMWCRKTVSGKVVVNAIVSLVDFRVYQYYYDDKTTGEPDSTIIWMFWRTKLPGPLSWQAAVTIAGKEFPALNGEFPEAQPQ